MKKISWLLFFSCNLLFADINSEWSFAFDQFRGSSDGSWEGNVGGLTSLNLRMTLPKDYSIQIGGSYGVYDWAGRLSTPAKNSKTAQQQAFLMGALSKTGSSSSEIHFGLAIDWMLNSHFGEYATSPLLSQMRAQIGHLFKKNNEFGVWGTVNTCHAKESYNKIALQFRAISQLNLFWCHYFENYAYTMFWGGAPYQTGLMHRSKRPGTFIFGTRFSAPLSASLSMSGHAAYMGASIHKARNYAANVCIALTYTFGNNTKLSTPYMGLPDNSNFLVDTNVNY